VEVPLITPKGQSMDWPFGVNGDDV
jgi:hypothetical protein